MTKGVWESSGILVGLFICSNTLTGSFLVHGLFVYTVGQNQVKWSWSVVRISQLTQHSELWDLCSLTLNENIIGELLTNWSPEVVPHVEEASRQREFGCSQPEPIALNYLWEAWNLCSVGLRPMVSRPFPAWRAFSSLPGPSEQEGWRPWQRNTDHYSETYCVP